MSTLTYLQETWMDMYPQRFLRVGTLGIMMLHMFRRPVWTYDPIHANWYNPTVYPSFNLARLPIEVSYCLDIMLQGLVTWALWTILYRPQSHHAPCPPSRVKILRHYAAPICIVKFLNCIVQLSVVLALGHPPPYTSSPLEAILFILCEPCFESTLYRTMYRSIPYFTGLMFLLVVVVLSWSVLGMVVINSGREADPSMTSLMDCVWNMLTVLNTANWPNPVIPSYDANTAYFVFFIAYSVVVDWGFLNLVLGLIVAFFEASWLNDNEAPIKEGEGDNLPPLADVASSKEGPSAFTKNPMIEIEMTPIEKAAEAPAVPPMPSGSEQDDDHDDPPPVPALSPEATRESHHVPSEGNTPTVPLEEYSWWVRTAGPFVNNKVFDLVTDFTLFVLGFNFIFGSVPNRFLTVQIILNAAELVLRISIKKESMLEWFYVFRNLSNATLITILFSAAQTYLSMCQDGADLSGTPSCDPLVLNRDLSPLLDRKIIFLVVVIRACILVRISLVARNFTWDYIPKKWQQHLTRVNNIILETSKALSHLVIMLMTMMYIFSSIGCSLWGGKLSRDPTLPGYDALMHSSYAEARYWPLNFNDMFGAFITMFTLLYINNMQIITDGCSAISTVEARWFFVLFYIFGVLYVRNIFTSFLWSRIGRILDPDALPIEDADGEGDKDETVDQTSAFSTDESDPDMRMSSVRLKTMLRTQHSIKRIDTTKHIDTDDLDNVLRKNSSGLTLAERACLVMFSAKTGLRLKLDHSHFTVKAYKILKKMDKWVLLVCWLLTIMRIFQNPPWLQDLPEKDFGNFMFSRTPIMTPQTKAILKVPLLVFLQGMLSLEAMSTRGGWSSVVIFRYCLMTINFASFCCVLIGGITNNLTAHTIDFYLSFFSINYTFWFDPNALKRMKIVTGVVPKLFILCTVFLFFVMLMALYGDFMFGLEDVNLKIFGDDDDYDANYYSNYGNSVWTTAVAITSSSYPSQFMPVLRAYKEYSMFLLIVISIGGFVILEGSIAVVNTAYQNGVVERSMFTIKNQEDAVRGIFLSLAAAKKRDAIKQSSSLTTQEKTDNPDIDNDPNYVDPEHVENLFHELFENFSQNNGCAGLTERAILRTIMDFDNDGKIGRDDFKLLVHVVKIQVVKVPRKFLTPKEKMAFHDIKHRIREETEQDMLNNTSTWQRRVYRMKLFREGCSYSIRKWVASTWMNVLEKKHYDLVADSVAGVLSVFAVLLRSSPDVHESLALLLMFFFLVEFILKVFLLSLGPYIRDVRNVMDLTVGLAMLFFLVMGSATNSLFHGDINFWSIGLDMIEMLRLLLYPRNVACFASPVNGVAWKSVLSTIGKLSFAFAEAFTCMGFTYAQLGCLLFGGVIPRLGVNAALDKSPFGQNNFYILNFNDMTSSFFTLFCCLRVSDWDVVTNGYQVTRSNAVRIYFVGWYVLGVLLMFNILKSYFVIVFRPKGSLSHKDEDMAIDEDVNPLADAADAASMWERSSVTAPEEEDYPAKPAAAKGDIAADKDKQELSEEEELDQLDARNISGDFVLELDTLVYPKNPLRVDNVKFISIKADKGFVDGLKDVAEKHKGYNSWDRSSTHSMVEVDKKYHMVMEHNVVRYQLFLPYKKTMEDSDRLKILRRLARLSNVES